MSEKFLLVQTYLADNPWVTLLGLFIGVLSLILSFYFYKKTKRIKRISYGIRSHNLIRDFVSNIKDLKITYSNEPIENLTVSKIVLWNSGNEVIKYKDDIIESEPIIIRAQGGNRLLDAKIIRQNETTNIFDVSPVQEKTHAIINFDYVRENNGVVIQAFHTGKSSNDIEISGMTRDAGKPVYVSLENDSKDIFRSLIYFALPILITSIIIDIFILDEIGWSTLFKTFFILYYSIITLILFSLPILGHFNKKPGTPSLLPLVLTKPFGVMFCKKGDNVSTIFLKEPEELAIVRDDFTDFE